MSNFRANVSRAVQKAWSVCFSIFCDFCKAVIIHTVCMISPCSSPDSDPFYDILNPADVAEVLLANSISQSVAGDASPHGRRESSTSSSSSYRNIFCILSSIPVPVYLRCWYPTFAPTFCRPGDNFPFWFSIFCYFCKPVIIHPVYQLISQDNISYSKLAVPINLLLTCTLFPSESLHVKSLYDIWNIFSIHRACSRLTEVC